MHRWQSAALQGHNGSLEHSGFSWRHGGSFLLLFFFSSFAPRGFLALLLTPALAVRQVDQTRGNRMKSALQ
jgi:hypothetical protein